MALKSLNHHVPCVPLGRLVLWIESLWMFISFCLQFWGLLLGACCGCPSDSPPCIPRLTRWCHGSSHWEVELMSPLLVSGLGCDSLITRMWMKWPVLVKRLSSRCLASITFPLGSLLCCVNMTGLACQMKREMWPSPQSPSSQPANLPDLQLNVDAEWASLSPSPND